MISNIDIIFDIKIRYHFLDQNSISKSDINFRYQFLISKFDTKTFETEEITITGSAVKIPVFSSDFNVDSRFLVFRILWKTF